MLGFPEHARQLCKMALASDRREFLRVNEAHELLEKAVANDSGTRNSLLRRISDIPSHSE